MRPVISSAHGSNLAVPPGISRYCAHLPPLSNPELAYNRLNATPRALGRRRDTHCGQSMKTILCFGDSNTYGYDPLTRQRLDRDTRWPGALRNTLGQGYDVIEEGLGGRTTVWDDPLEGSKNGRTYLIPCLASHAPLDLVIIMLGTNDLKKRFSLSAYDIAEGVRLLVSVALTSGAGPHSRAPQVLLVAPPPTTTLSDFAEMFEGAEEKSRKFAAYYARVARESGCYFLDAGSVIVSSPLDGIHFEAAQHVELGKAVAAKVQVLDWLGRR
jgi:lysophospholipase L1-like esterase